MALGRRLRTKHRQTMRARLREIMEPFAGGPESTSLSLVVDMVVLVTIVASCGLVFFSHRHPEYGDVIWALELGFCIFFVVEYSIRWYAAPNRWVYPVTRAAIIDLLAILPTLLVLTPDALLLRLVRGFRLLRLLRFLRLVRLLRVFRYGHLIRDGLLNLHIAFSAVRFQYRLDNIARLVLWVLVAWVVGANAVHLTELYLVGPVGPYGQYWESYWSIVIVLTSGIEDKEPFSVLARIEVTLLLIAGMAIVGLFTAEIVSALVRRSQLAGKIPLKPPSGRFAHHIIIFGNNGHVDAIVRQLVAAFGERHHILIVSPDAEQIQVTDPAIYRRVYTLCGDPIDEQTHRLADLDRAARVIVLSQHTDDSPAIRDSRTLMTTLAVIGARDDVPVVAELLCQESLRQGAILDGVEFVLASRYGARLASRAVLDPGVADVYHQLMTFGHDSCELYTTGVPAVLVGQTFAHAQGTFHANEAEPMTLVGIAEAGNDEQQDTRYTLCPSAVIDGRPLIERVLEPTDRLVIAAYQQPSYDDEQSEDLWTHKTLSRH